MYQEIDSGIGDFGRKDLDRGDLDRKDICSDPPTEEPARQYYFIERCREWVKDFEQKKRRLPRACVTTFGCPNV